MSNATKYYMAYAYAMMLPLLLPLALPAYTPHAGNPKTAKREHLIDWYTSGFE